MNENEKDIYIRAAIKTMLLTAIVLTVAMLAIMAAFFVASLVFAVDPVVNR